MTTDTPANADAIANTAEADAFAAADAIIADFANHRRDAYFAGFAPDATFVFHSAPQRLNSRAEYEAMWQGWESENGFAVESCVSTDRMLQLAGNVAIFTHSVETVASFDGVAEPQHERETIVLELREGQWLAIHEHLSALTS
ncbi:MAG: nuclear transport factor 2 family protein [Microbacteriaceae bacterium]|nr:nuclear transport factor 2 family protein [Microbacteriaceae bacterium]